MIRKGLKVPVYGCYTRRIAGLNMFYGEKRYPINEAIRRSLEIVGLKLELSGFKSQIISN